MNPITTVGSISTMTVKPSADTASAKTAPPAEGAKAFSVLLKALADGGQPGENQEAAMPKALLKKIEDMLAELQEQPIEELTDAQQKIMYELMQIINFQPERSEGTILVDTAGRRKFTSILPDAQKQALPADVQVKLVELVKKLSDILPETSTTGNKKFDLSSPVMGVDSKAIALNAEKIVEITNKILEFTESLVAGDKKVTEKLGVITVPEAEKQMKIAADGKTANADEPEAVKVQASATVVTAARSDGGQQQETSQQDDSEPKGMQLTASAESAKPSGAPVQAAQPVQARPEAPAMPTPVVRMNNLTEELGQVFKNSLRMTVNGESTQIKVNISPDNLGHLDIRLTETNGKIAAQIFTSSMAAKDAIDLQLNQLRNTLAQQGLTVEKIEVVQNNSQQSLDQQNAQAEQRFQQQQQRQNSAGRENNGYQQSEEKAAVERNYLDSGVMKVDYTV
ncbi:flagellar hook-length control protein FliK [Metaplanococcus flavidus]|uniref:Flagellar hook-length control protein FliK n=1 Tax=Metaplanococcus flavidus TaxID=569883 RepID=A0ABW3LH32_9BACL